MLSFVSVFTVYEGVPNVPSCFKNSPALPPVSPKLVLAVPAFVKSDKLLDFANFVPTVVTKLASEPESSANEAESSPNVSNVEPAVPTKSVSSCCTYAVVAILLNHHWMKVLLILVFQ